MREKNKVLNPEGGTTELSHVFSLTMSNSKGLRLGLQRTSRHRRPSTVYWLGGKSSVMDLERHKRVFDFIASLYSWFFRRQIKNYTRIIAAMKEHYPALFPLPGSHVLDIGCGTGAFTRALELSGYRVEGVDISQRMVQIAREHNLRCRITTLEENGELPSRLPFDDNSFDLVTAAQVVHGLETEARRRLFEEALRISRGPLIFHDYKQKHGLFIDFIELLEGGGYFSFVKQGLSEMNSFFDSVEVFPVARHANWYVCRSRNPKCELSF